MSDDQKQPQKPREVPQAPKTVILNRDMPTKGNVPRMENPPPPPKNNYK
jgi:hypothetical protein